MFESIRGRLTIIGVAFAFCLVWVTPNFIDVEKIWWPSKDRIVMGLDIQGGLHLVLGVDIEGVVEETTQRMTGTIKAFLEEEKIEFKDVAVVNARRGAIRIELESESNPEAVEDFINSQYQGMFQIIDSGPDFVEFQYLETYLIDYRKRIVGQSIETIRNRIDEFGVSEPNITAQGSDRILVQLPGIEDAARAKRLINRTARLEFMLVEEEITQADLSAMIAAAEKEGEYSLKELPYSEYVEKLNTDLKEELPENSVVYFEKAENATEMEAGKIPYLLRTDTDLTGEDLKDAYVSFNEFGSPEVTIIFTPAGANKFSELTGKNVGRQMAVVLDNVVKSAPVIQGRIPGGRGVITLGTGRNRQQMMEEARLIAMSLRAGALPASLEQLEERAIGPTLGQEAIQAGEVASAVGLVLVILFMLIYYRKLGGVASIALIFNLLMILAILSALRATLTLPGVAGIALTIGMAVDANIIIFERIKEELRKGSGLSASIKAGFGNALSAIIDANITTAAVCVVLMYFGSGPIRGFAVTLLVGIVTSMFTAIFVTKTSMDVLVSKFKVKSLTV